MGDPYVREVGRVSDMDGYQGVIGVNYDTVTVAASPSPVAPTLRLTSAQAEEFAQLFVSACWAAGENKRHMAEEVHEADGGDSMEGCDAQSEGFVCTELGPHTVHLARSIYRIEHAWDREVPDG